MKTGNEFDFDVLARGAFIDDLRVKGYSPSDESIYKVEVVTIRLNHFTLNEYIMTICNNCRECYPDGEEGDKQWKEHEAEKNAKYASWKKNILDMLCIEIKEGESGAVVQQVQSEIFTVFCCTKIQVQQTQVAVA